MINLSQRLNTIADNIEDKEDVADIGTDHGYLPLYLLEKNPGRKAIFCDINEGPLDKARDIIKNEFPENDLDDYDIRLGDGLTPVEPGEVDAIVIAGMGGILIRDILHKDIDKSRSFKKYIFQPRTAADKLRRYLTESGYFITHEELAYEKGRICEIIVTIPQSEQKNNEFKDELDYEFSPILLKNKSKITTDWLNKLIKTENDIKHSIESKGSNESMEKLDTINKRLNKLNNIKKNMTP